MKDQRAAEVRVESEARAELGHPQHSGTQLARTPGPGVSVDTKNYSDSRISSYHADFDFTFIQKLQL